ncbi:porin [Rouxiella sp. Mn2063]|uniref:porin n=1 Tax=Rouxiella sp. Mn2063 TaxID=3395262 RepID=UPI003BDCEA7C
MNKFTTSIIIGGVVLSIYSASAPADIILLAKDPKRDALSAPLSFKISGSIRPEWSFNNDNSSDYHTGHDGGSRFRFTTDYALSQHTSVVGYYEVGVDMAHLLHMNGHYDKHHNATNQRQLYAGFSDDRYGRFTLGHQYGVYYSVIAGKSDIWDNDAQAVGDGVGVGSNYDGSSRPKRSLKYTNVFGPVTLYADYLLPQDKYPLSSGFYYRRTRGGGLGLDYKINQDLTLGLAYNLTAATISNMANRSKKYHQQLSGAAFTWTPNNWYVAGTASYYKDFVPSKRQRRVSKYFAGSGYGIEGFVGYTVNIDKPYLKFIQPYVAADSLRLKGDEDYHASHTYVGVDATVGYGFSIYVERTFATKNDRTPDQTFVTLFYDF